MSVPTFNLPRQHARAARMAYSCGPAAKLRPSHPHPRSDLAPVAKAALGLAAAILGPTIVFGLKLYSMGVQGGMLPWL